MILNVMADIKLKKTLTLILTILPIFYISHQPGDDSSGMSREVRRMVCQVVVGNFEKMTAPEQDRMLDSMEFWVRKSAAGVQEIPLQRKTE